MVEFYSKTNFHINRNLKYIHNKYDRNAYKIKLQKNSYQKTFLEIIAIDGWQLAIWDIKSISFMLCNLLFLESL
jgi:hypothetical protein